MTPTRIQHDVDYDEAIEGAEREFRAPDASDLAARCPYIRTSNMADAWFITAWSLYYTGLRPRALHKSRGHSWLVDQAGYGIARVTVDGFDHRNGITVQA